tara:strand:- start:42 stop:437 length:396 start_codon:yes stop_codon:yes gene_type:complete
MATTTATLTLASGDLTGDALSLSSTSTLTKLGVATGLDQTTGVGRKYYAAATTAGTLIAAADYTSAKAHKVYIKNLSSDDAETVEILVGSQAIGKLSGGDFTFLPYDGATDINITTSTIAMTVEYMVVFEA